MCENATVELRQHPSLARQGMGGGSAKPAGQRNGVTGGSRRMQKLRVAAWKNCRKRVVARSVPYYVAKPVKSAAHNVNHRGQALEHYDSGPSPDARLVWRDIASPLLASPPAFLSMPNNPASRIVHGEDSASVTIEEHKAELLPISNKLSSKF